jgi:hypothetical protein
MRTRASGLAKTETETPHTDPSVNEVIGDRAANVQAKSRPVVRSKRMQQTGLNYLSAAF